MLENGGRDKARNGRDCCKGPTANGVQGKCVEDGVRPWNARAIFEEITHHTRRDDQVACYLHCYRSDEKA